MIEEASSKAIKGKLEIINEKEDELALSMLLINSKSKYITKADTKSKLWKIFYKTHHDSFFRFVPIFKIRWSDFSA